MTTLGSISLFWIRSSSGSESPRPPYASRNTCTCAFSTWSPLAPLSPFCSASHLALRGVAYLPPGPPTGPFNLLLLLELETEGGPVRGLRRPERRRSRPGGSGPGRELVEQRVEPPRVAAEAIDVGEQGTVAAGRAVDVAGLARSRPGGQALAEDQGRIGEPLDPGRGGSSILRGREQMHDPLGP